LNSQTELDDMVRKPTNKLITDKLKENIYALLNNVSLGQVSSCLRTASDCHAPF
jgi:hypothetical protein